MLLIALSLYWFGALFTAGLFGADDSVTGGQALAMSLAWPVVLPLLAGFACSEFINNRTRP